VKAASAPEAAAGAVTRAGAGSGEQQQQTGSRK